MTLARLLPETQKLSLARYVIDTKLSQDQRERLVWELIRADTWAGRLMFALMEQKHIGPSTALDVLLAVIKESQNDKYHRTG